MQHPESSRDEPVEQDRHENMDLQGNPHTIKTADVSELVESSSEEVLSQINTRCRKIAIAPFALVGTAIVSLLAVSLGGIVSIGILLTGLVSSWILHHRDKLKRTTPLFYELEPDAANRFLAIQKACESLTHSEQIWRVEAQQPNWDWKRNAGAASLITRCRVATDRRGPPFIATNIDTWCIDIRDFKLFFFPDHIFVLRSKTYGAVSYDSVNVTYIPTRFIENDRVPSDSEKVGYTWKYVNKGGGPDRRFKNNHQIPIVLYGLLEITSATGFNIHLHLSNKSMAESFAKNFSSLRNQSFCEDSRRRSTTEERTIPKCNEVGYRIKSAYELLGIKAGASLDDITSAYHQMAQMHACPLKPRSHCFDALFGD